MSPRSQGSSPTHDLWSMLRRPFDLAEVVDVAFGLPEKVVDQLIGSRLATSDEAERLLHRMPVLSRSLATTVTSKPERCQGELRGPVLWSETTAARGASAGAPDVFVCAVPRRDYNIDENRVLVAALVAIREAGQAADLLPADAYDDETLRRARANGSKAHRWLQSAQLAKVPKGRPTGREIRRVRAGTRRSTYLPALKVLEQAYEPLTADDLVPFCDQRTSSQHRLLVNLHRGLADRGVYLPGFRANRGALRTGAVEYYHPRLRGERDRVHGILVHDLLIDVADVTSVLRRDVATAALASRAGGRESMVVLDGDDLTPVIDRVAELISEQDPE